MSETHTPVTILSGGLGAGKTTLLNHLLKHGGEERDIAVLVNDMGEVNIDAELVEEATELTAENGGVAELSNGCICCGLQGELDRELVRLALSEEFDYLVVEASGISDPAPIARTFVRSSRAAGFYDLDTLVIVVNAAQFHRAFVAGERIESNPEDGTRPLSELLAEQVECSNLLALNKCDLVSEQQLDRVEHTLETLQPDVTVIRTTHGQLIPEAVLDARRFDPEEMNRSAGWKQALAEYDEPDSGSSHDTHGQPDDPADVALGSDEHSHSHAEESSEMNDHDHDHLHPPKEYGVESFVFNRQRPFHPERFHEWLESFPESVLRSKGHMWVAGRERQALNLSQAGEQTRIDVNGRWVVSLSESQQERYRESRSEQHWDDEWGDRESKLVFIGSGMDEPAIRDSLDACIVSETEMDADWEVFENSFPAAYAEELVFNGTDVEQRVVPQ